MPSLTHLIRPSQRVLPGVPFVYNCLLLHGRLGKISVRRSLYNPLEVSTEDPNAGKQTIKKKTRTAEHPHRRASVNRNNKNSNNTTSHDETDQLQWPDEKENNIFLRTSSDLVHALGPHCPTPLATSDLENGRTERRDAGSSGDTADSSIPLNGADDWSSQLVIAMTANDNRLAAEAERDSNTIKLKIEQCRQKTIKAVLRLLELGLTPDAIQAFIPTMSDIPAANVTVSPFQGPPFPDATLHDRFQAIASATPSEATELTIITHPILWEPLEPPTSIPFQTTSSTVPQYLSADDPVPASWLGFGENLWWLGQSNVEADTQQQHIL